MKALSALNAAEDGSHVNFLQQESSERGPHLSETLLDSNMGRRLRVPPPWSPPAQTCPVCGQIAPPSSQFAGSQEWAADGAISEEAQEPTFPHDRIVATTQ